MVSLREMVVAVVVVVGRRRIWGEGGEGGGRRGEERTGGGTSGCGAPTQRQEKALMCGCDSVSSREQLKESMVTMSTCHHDSK